MVTCPMPAGHLQAGMSVALESVIAGVSAVRVDTGSVGGGWDELRDRCLPFIRVYLPS